MINFASKNNNMVALTLNEKRLYNDSELYMVLLFDATNQQKEFRLNDISTNPERYNLFNIYVTDEHSEENTDNSVIYLNNGMGKYGEYMVFEYSGDTIVNDVEHGKFKVEIDSNISQTCVSTDTDVYTYTNRLVYFEQLLCDDGVKYQVVAKAGSPNELITYQYEPIRFEEESLELNIANVRYYIDATEVFLPFDAPKNTHLKITFDRINNNEVSKLYLIGNTI